MRLLIVVDKLLTGFDAPSATYLYIDKTMADHGLFQAICRVNRLDGDDKQYGYIVDYRDLFNSLETAITDYTGGALDGYDKTDIEGLLTDRLASARSDLDEALERIRALCEPVAPPRGIQQFQHYFCAAEQGNAEQIKANEPKRVKLYKMIAAVTRAYANLANDMTAAGYSAADAAAIRSKSPDTPRCVTRSNSAPGRTSTSSSMRPVCGISSTPTSVPSPQRWCRISMIPA